MMVKDEWNMVQCSNCEKINRIPNVKPQSSKQEMEELNHFDISFPYVVQKVYLVYSYVMSFL
jgi:hypothetical protein